MVNSKQRKSQKLSDLNFQNFFNPGLLSAKPYPLADQAKEVKLDQNECPEDLPEFLKDKILEELKKSSWNRYPEGFSQEIEDLLAKKYQLENYGILTAPGSNLLLHILFDCLLPAGGECLIARPSFVVYEDYVLKKGIPYKTWLLNSEREFDLSRFPDLPANSVVILATPNNPAGNDISLTDLDHLLSKYRESLFIVDEAYFEFAEFSYAPLLKKHQNLILVRTFSKAIGLAGLRFGYAIAPKNMMLELKKMRLPFLLNHWQIACCKILLEWEGFDSLISSRVKQNHVERQKILLALSGVKNLRCKVSKANFLVVEFLSQDECLRKYQELAKANISLRNISGVPGLGSCLRLSIGKPEENQKAIEILKR